MDILEEIGMGRKKNPELVRLKGVLIGITIPFLYIKQTQAKIKVHI